MDEQSDDGLRDQCNATLGALSPNGPADAYEYVARNPALTGVDEITRSTSTSDSVTGEVEVYVGGASGAVSSASVAAAQAAIDVWATPLCVTAVAESATAIYQDFAGIVSGNDIPATYNTLIADALGVLVGGLDIGETLSYASVMSTVYLTLVAAGATNVLVNVTLPALSTAAALNQVFTVNSVSFSEV